MVLSHTALLRTRATAAVVSFLVVVAAAATATAASHAIRVPATANRQLATIGVQAEHDLDYGSFRWIVVDDAGLARIEAAGIPHTTVPEAGIVQVQGYRFDPVVSGEPQLPEGLRDSSSRAGAHLVQLVGPVRDGWARRMAAAGLRILQYYPHNSYLVWADSTALDDIQTASWLRWRGAFHPAYKINAEIQGRVGIIRNVEVLFVNDGHIAETLEAFVSHGAVLLGHAAAQPDRALHTAYLELNASRIDDVARIPTVLWIGYQSPEPVLDDEMSDQIIAGNHAGGAPFTGYNNHLLGLGFDGSGVIWSINDTGVDYDHPDLATRIVGGHTYPGCPTGSGPGDDPSSGGHGTHVAGIVGGDATAGSSDGGGFLYGLGVAPGYSIFAQNPVCGTHNSWPPAGGWQEISKNAVLGGSVGGNNSWTTGEGTHHGYQASERTHDLIVRDGNFDTDNLAEPYIEVFSAGNSGSGGLTAPKEAKNLIVVAASENYRFGGDIDDIASFSSRGPAEDGRWVPTITAPGDDIASTRNDLGGLCASPIGGTGGLYAFCSGTSMAAPHASGAIALATGWWRSLFTNDDNPSPAMAKALLVNSADDMAAPDIPNNREGWGRINITTLIDPSVPREYWDQTEIFTSSGEQIVVTVDVPEPGEPLKVTLAWSDAPGAVGANPALVNNLDLTVDTGDSTYHGNVFAAGWSATGGAADTLNNLENVFVQTPGSSAVITVDATAIVGDGVPYNGHGIDQDFALVCTNCIVRLEPELDIFDDGFESGDTSAWSNAVP